MSRIHRCARILAIVLLVTLGQATPAFAQAGRQQWALASDGFVEIQQTGGWLRVTGWDRPEVVMTTATPEAVDALSTDRRFRMVASPSDSAAPGVELRAPWDVRLSIRGDSLSVGVSEMKGVVEVRLGVGEVKVDGGPREVLIDLQHGRADASTVGSVVQVEAVSADASVRATGGRTDVSTVSGNLFVVADGVEGRFQTVSGRMEISGARSQIRAESGSGDIELDWRDGNAEASTVSGSIRAMGDKFKSGRFESYSGNIRFASSLADAGNLDVYANQGSVAVDVPSASGDVFVATESGGIRVTGEGLDRGRFESEAGAIRFDGTVEAAGALDVVTGGRVELAVPRSLDANFQIESRGHIRNSFGPAPRDDGGSTLAFTNGKGGAWVSVKAGGDFVLEDRSTADLRDPMPVSTVDSLYDAIVERIGSEPTDHSIEALEDLADDHPGYAPAYHQLALLYMSKKTIRDRQWAEKALVRAMRLDPDNVDYQTTWGDLLWAQGFWYNSARHYEEVLAQHPESARASYGVGRRDLREYLAYRDRIGAGAGGDLQWLPEAKVTHDRALEHLSRAVELDSTLRKAYVDLGRLHLEAGRPKKLVEVAEQLRERYPNDTDALLFTALGYQQAGEETKAAEVYEKALAGMEPDERAIMESVELIASDEEASAIGPWEEWTLPGGDLTESHERSRFWRKQDPLYLTEANERRLEHYGRVAYANLAFSRPDDGIPGWKTDMGRATIKFGRPVGRQASYTREQWIYEGFSLGFQGDGLDGWSFYTASLHRDEGQMFAALNRAMQQPPFTGVWRPGRGYTLRNPAISHAYRSEELRRLRRSSENLQSSPREVFEDTPPRFVDPYEEHKYLLPHQIARFRRDDDLLLEVAYAMPAPKVARDTATGAVQLEEGVFVFDDRWDEVGRRIEEVRELAAPAAADSGRSYYVRHFAARVKPSARRVVLETLDMGSKSIGVARMDRELLEGDTTLVLSDLLLASEIRPLKPFPEARDDLDIQANPLRIYDKNEPILLYFETYNLQRDALGRTRYEVSYEIGWPDDDEVDRTLFPEMDLDMPDRTQYVQVEVIREQAPADIQLGDDPGGRMTQLIRSELSRPGRIIDYKITYARPKRKLFDFGGSGERRVWETAVTAEYIGDRSDDMTYLAIDPRDVPPGVHTLTVTVRDRNGRTEASRSVLFRLRGGEEATAIEE